MVTKQTQRRKFDVKFKEDVLRYAAEHSGEKAAKHFDIDSRQVRYWKKQKDELMAEPDNKRARLPGGGRKRASDEMETQLSDWIRSMQRDEHDRVSRKTIQNKAKEIYLTVSDGGKAFAASKGWLQKFLRRNGPSLRRRTTVAQTRNNPVCRISTVQGKQRRTFDLKFKLAVVKYAEQNSGEASARHFNVDPKQVREWKQKKGELGSLSAIHGKRVRLSGGGRKKVTEELDSVESRLQVQMNSPDPAGFISVKEEDPEDQPDLNQCVESRLQVTMNSPDSSMAISIKQEEPEEHQHLSASQPYQVSGHVFPAERERSVQLPHPSYDIYFDDSDETQLSQGSRQDHFAVERGSSQQQTASASGQLGAGTDHEPPDAFEQSVLHSLQELREEGRLEMDTHYFMHFVGHRMDKLNARKKAKLQMAIHQALLDAERSDSD